MKYFSILLLLSVLLSSCSKDDTVSSNDPVNSDYVKITTFESSALKLEVWSATGNSFFNGYNDIGFKVFIGGSEKNTGFVKFTPKMYHFPGSPAHSSPVSQQYLYDSETQLFSGYVCFTMISDTTGSWYGFFNYNNEAGIDSAYLNVGVLSSNQTKVWDNISSGYTYVLTLVHPQNPKLGLNSFTCMLHRTINDLDYSEVNDAQMFVRPWMETMGHGSSNNTDPSHTGGGRYEGKVNFTMSGLWVVYDSVKVQGNFITNNPPPKFNFDVP